MGSSASSERPAAQTTIQQVLFPVDQMFASKLTCEGVGSYRCICLELHRHGHVAVPHLSEISCCPQASAEGTEVAASSQEAARG